MINKIILLHGKDADPSKKWYPQVKELAKKLNYEFIASNLPEADNPEINAWMKEIEKAKPDENSILIGHSRGGVAILRFLEQQQIDFKVKKVILVATNSGKSNESKRGFFTKEGYDFEKIKIHCDDFVVIHSKDDEWVSFSEGEENAKGLSCKFKVYENKGHFGRTVIEVPEILEEILNI